MAPLIVLVFSFVIFSLLGADGFDAWESSLRWALAAMFIFTGIAHFTRTRADLVRMVPPRLPRPEVLVTITGVLEIVGAVGLLIPSLALPAACGLIAMLVAMFPANLRAANERLTVAGRVAMGWPGRLALQLFWIAALWLVARG